MKISLLKPTGITPAIRAQWTAVLYSNSSLCSPYFSPEFTQIVASARGDVEVAMVEDGGKVIAFIPYHRRRWNVADPVGSFISDYNGAICSPDTHLEPQTILRACGLNAWDFNHMPTSQAAFAPFFWEQHRSPIIDLSAGYEVYVKERRGAGTEQIRKSGNLRRRLEREVGPLRFAAHSPDKALLQRLLQWKTTQFRQNGWRDLFSIPWVRQVADEIHSSQAPEFAGMLSALYAGEQLIAVHFGMRSATIWHYWFPAYNPTFAKYSPGVMLLLEMAKAATAMGIRAIDLGCGEHSYKERLMNGFVETASGRVEIPGFVAFARRVMGLPSTVRATLGRTRMGGVVRRACAGLR